MELGVILPPLPRRSASIARAIEAMGFATLLYPDSQNLAPDTWSELCLAAGATTRLKLGPSVTNSVTRDAAVTAAAALTLQVESQGRAVLGLGRGDSAVQRIGKREDRVASFERYLATLQTYLRGGAVARDGFDSRIEWLAEVDLPKVPVFVAATGPRVIEVAARQADAVCLAAGADPAHLEALLARARAAAAAAGRDPQSLRYGAFVTSLIHPDRQLARDALRGAVATFARFSAFNGSDLTRLPEPLRSTAQYLRAHYDMRDHTRTDVAHTAGISDEFVDWFAIAGPVEIALPRFRQLAALGLDFCYVVAGSSNMSRDVASASLMGLAQDIVPALH